MLHTDDRLEAGRRQLLFGLLALGALSMAGTAVSRSMAVQAWIDPSCGCCEDWIAHLEMHGFTATAYDQRNDAARVRARLPSKFASCHTALVQGYAIKGHVPAADIQRLLRERHRAIGVAVPGKPIGTPGMDGAAYGGRRDAFHVLMIRTDGSSQVFSSYASATG